MVPYLFATQELLLFPCGALFWPAEQALIVADLHFEKARFFAQTGQFLPPYDSHETALQLADRIALTNAKKVICLGDSFHDETGARHMPRATLDLLQSLESLAEWIWITGNHDSVAHFMIGRAEPEIRVRGIALCHEASRGRPEPEISGHFHPKIRFRHKGHSIARRCFLASDTKLIVPAFGALTGGLDAGHPALQTAMGRAATALVPLHDRLLRFPVAAPTEPCR